MSGAGESDDETPLADVVSFPGRGVPLADDGLDPYPDLDDDEEFFKAWDDAQAGAVDLLREALADLVGEEPPPGALELAADRLRTGIQDGRWPFQYIRRAAGFKRDRLPGNDLELWIAAAASLISMKDETGMGAEADAALMALELADWLGAVVGLVRAGVGASAEPEDLVEYINDCPEIDGEIDEDDESVVEYAFELLLPVWEAAGAVDSDRRLTALGRWGLPRAVAKAWNGEFDAGDEA